MGIGDAAWVARTFAFHAAKNALFRAAPRTSMALQRLTRDTGRGRGRDGAAGAEYFEAVAADYRVVAAASGAAGERPFVGKHVLELGPGDTRAVALLTRLEGATAWEGFDAFDIQSRDAPYVDAIYDALLARRSAPQAARALLDGCKVHTSAGSLLAGGPRFNVVVSRATLEHVRELATLFSTVARVAKDDAVWLHKVDLRSHGVERTHPLDFLRFSERAWRAMSSHVDLPNRARARAYLALGESVGLVTVWAKTTHVLDLASAAEARPRLATPFRALDASELAVLGLWLVQVGPNHPLASRPTNAWPLGPAPHADLSHH